jgi:hypothetical protein
LVCDKCEYSYACSFGISNYELNPGFKELKAKYKIKETEELISQGVLQPNKKKKKKNFSEVKVITKINTQI